MDLLALLDFDMIGTVATIVIAVFVALLLPLVLYAFVQGIRDDLAIRRDVRAMDHHARRAHTHRP